MCTNVAGAMENHLPRYNVSKYIPNNFILKYDSHVIEEYINTLEIPLNFQDDFKNFIALKWEKVLALIKKAYRKYEWDFINVFSHCCGDIEIWEKILYLCQQDNAVEQLESYSNILWLEYKFDSNNSDLSVFLESLISQIKVAVESTLEDDLSDEKKAKTRFMKDCFAKVRAGGNINMEEFNENSLWYHMYPLQWWHIIKDQEILEMFSAWNYRDPESFSVNDWAIIYDSILSAYPGFDKSLCFKVAKSFCASLNSSSAEFFILRRHKEFMWIMSLDTREQGCLYVWNFYVNQKCCFWAWSLLEHVVLQFTKWFKLKATSVLNDTSSFRHIEKSIWIWSGITHKVYGEEVPFPILVLEYDDTYDFKSRNIKKQDFFEKCKNNEKNDTTSFLYFHKKHSEKNCQDFFDQWYFLTRWIMWSNEMVHAAFEKKL
jgi:hypothetical protein